MPRTALLSWRLIVIAAMLGLLASIVTTGLSVLWTHRAPGVFGAHNLDGRFVREGEHTYFTERSRAVGMDYYLSYRTAPVADDRVSTGKDYRPRYARNAFHNHANSVITYDAGWPLRVVRGTRVVPPNAADPAYEIGIWRVNGVVVPLWPIWINTTASIVLFGGLATIPMVGWARARATRRRRRGVCVGCGYDLGGLDNLDVACPECGTKGRS